MSVQKALSDAVARLVRAGVESPELDARALMAHVLGLSSGAQVGLRLTDGLSVAQQAAFRSLVTERETRRPVSHLIGSRGFWDLEFFVSSDVLDPRPDSETLIEAVIERRPDQASPLSILDLGTGSGCLLLTLLRLYRQAQGVGVDQSEAALAMAQRNADHLGLSERADLRLGNWCEGLAGSFDVVISNPPYIPSEDIPLLEPEVSEHEPLGALDGGEDGLEAYRQICAQAPKVMAPGGLLILELGVDQEDPVYRCASEAGLVPLGVQFDLNGRPRAFLAEKIAEKAAKT